MVSRKGDIIIVVCQNNDQKRLLVETVDAGIENLIGYEATELVGRDLNEILIPTVGDAVHSYLDFEDENSDLCSVLSKVRDFGFVTRLGYEVKVNMRINRTLSDDGYPRFEIIVKDTSEVSEGSKSALRNFRGRQVIDRSTGLPDKASFMKESEFINFCVAKNKFPATFALISLDGIENFAKQYGKENTDKVVRELVNRCKRCFREDDLLGALDNNALGAILLDASASVSKTPLNRLRWQIASQPFVLSEKEEVNVTLSIAYCDVSKSRTVEKAIEVCEAELQELRKSGGNKISEV